MKHPYQLSIFEIVETFAVSVENGLTHDQVNKQRELHGENVLPRAKKESFWSRAYHIVAEPLSLILLVAAGISFALGDLKDGFVITFIVFANAVMGLIQQAKAENALEALESMSVDEAVVVRNGEISRVPARELVPGDIIVLDAGCKIPSDARLLEVSHLQVTESALTGESRPVEKSIEALTGDDVPLGDRMNMVYKDSIVNYGRGRAVVIATGANTEIGKISQMLSGQNKAQTQLERELERVGKVLTIVAGISAAAVFAALFFIVGLPPKEIFFTAISIAIAVVPEGIPVVITTVLAISVTKLARRNAIIRRMAAVETLGAVSHILTDKTGTLTMNEMHVVHAGIGTEVFGVTSNGALEGVGAEQIRSSDEDAYRRMLECAVLCNDAEYRDDGNHIGDPTETALLVAAKEYGISIQDLRARCKRINEIPFDSDRKKMTVFVQDEHGMIFAYTKGAPEAVLGGVYNAPGKLQANVEALARNGIRNLAFSVRELGADKNVLGNGGMEALHALEEKQELLGFLGMKDPLRPEVKVAVAEARAAGVQTVMITGDHMLIATSIGKELGLISDDAQAMDGSTLGDTDVDGIIDILQTVRIFSRVSPEQKLRVVKAAQAMGAIVAVTGDGVNDAPAIKSANIGIAMGISGTDVTKEVADIVLRDDNYSTIVGAIEQGRVIFSNFVKFLRYQISCNLSGVLIIFIPSLFALQPAFLPIHILILNLFSETAPSIALGLEKGEKNVMSHPPRSSQEKLLTRARWVQIFLEAGLLSIAALVTYWFALGYHPAVLATATMTTAFFSRVWHAFNSRSEQYSIFSRLVPQNMWLIGSAGVTMVLYVGMIYTSIGNQWFSTVPMDNTLLLVSVGLSFVPVIGIEVLKVLRRRNAL